MPDQPFPSRQLHYTGGTLDRAMERRRDESWLSERLAHESSQILPVWRNRNLVDPVGEPTAVLITGETAREFLTLAEHVVLLGIEQKQNTAVFAADLSSHDDTALSSLTNGAAFKDLREIGPQMNHIEANMLAYARGLMYWHRHHQFCNICGHPTESRLGGHMRLCANTDCAREHYPRTDPAVIMLVTRDTPNGEVCLLAHKPTFPNNRYSVLAGYVDTGESLEEAVAREVKEETGVIVTDVTYRASQPWPFPSSLMLGFRARAISEEIICDPEELEDAQWFSREDIHAFPEKGIQLSRPDSIARRLIDEWLHEQD